MLLVAKDPEDEHRRIVASVKSNLSAAPNSLAYRIRLDGEGRPAIVWEGPVEISADQLLAAGATAFSGRSALEDAKEFLLTVLADGCRLATEVFREAKQAGHPVVTIRRAQKALRVKSTKDGVQWVWSLPEQGDQVLQKMITPAREHLDHLPPSEAASPGSAPVAGVDASGPCGYHNGPMDKPCQRCHQSYSDHVAHLEEVGVQQ